MPRVITEALDEPDVFATFLVLVFACLIIAWATASRFRRPRRLVALALLSVAAIVATTVVPQGGWGFLAQGYGEPLTECFGLDAWRGVAGQPIEADTLLNVVLFIPAGLLWVMVVGRPVRVVLALALLSVAIESWQALSHGRSCTANDVAANAAGALIGAALGALLAWLAGRVTIRR